MKIRWSSNIVLISMMGSPLKYISFGSQATRITQLLYHLKIVESQMSQTQTREEVLVLIVRLIHSYIMALYT